MAAGDSPMDGGPLRVRVDWFSIASKCDSCLQTFPHLAAFSASGSVTPSALVTPQDMQLV